MNRPLEMNQHLDLAVITLADAVGQVLQHAAVRSALARGDRDQADRPEWSAPVPVPPGADASVLILIDLPTSPSPRSAQSRLQGSVLAQGFKEEHEPAQADAVLSTALPPAAQQLIGQLVEEGQVLACRRRGAGGLLAAACILAFAQDRVEKTDQTDQTGVGLTLDMLTIDPVSADWGDYKIRPEQVAVQRHEAVLAALFEEAPGLLLQVPRAQRNAVLGRLRGAGLSACSHVVGSLNDSGQLQLFNDGRCIFQARRDEVLGENLCAEKMRADPAQTGTPSD